MIGADRFVENLSPDMASKHATQRYTGGISEIDMWNFDRFLADVIVAGCNWHMVNGQTSPWHLEQKEWHAILTEIRDGFLREDSNGVADPPKRAWKLLRKHYRNFWD